MDTKELEGGARLAEFFLICRADRENGRLRTVREYQALFPGIEELVERELLAVESCPSHAPSSRTGDLELPGYQIVSELGHGGQGTVYLAEDLQLRRLVALKVLRSTLGLASPKSLARLRREVGLLARLDHPGICAVFRAHLDHDPPFVAMRYVKGPSLAQILASTNAGAAHDECSAPVVPLRGIPRRAPDVERMLRFFEDAARALHAAHEAGIVHRDVKPANIVADDEGRPVLLDFGLARTLDGQESLVTLSGELFGTPAYMSPEQIDLSAEELDRRTDVYSLGVTLFECLTGRRPFEAPSQQRLALAIRHESVPRASRLNAGLPPDLDVVVATAMEKDRARRYTTALAFAEELQRVRERRPVLARPTSLVLRARRWAQRNPTGATALFLLVLGAFGLSIALARLAHEAEQTRNALRVAESRNLAANALSTLALNPLEGLRQALQSHELASGLHSRSALYAALNAQHIEREFFDRRSIPSKNATRWMLSPDREMLAVASDALDVWLYHVATGAVTHLGRVSSSSSALDATAGGRVVAVGCEDGSVRVFLREATPRMVELARHSSPVRAVAISPDSRFIASGANDAGIRIETLDGGGVGNGTALELRALAGPLGGLRYSADGDLLLSWPNEQFGSPLPSEFTPQLWSVRDGTCLARLTGHESRIEEARFAPDGARLVTASNDGTARVWELPEGIERFRLQHPSKVHDARFAPDGRFLATACDPGEPGEREDCGLRVFDASDGTLVLSVKGHESRAVASVDWSSDGRSLLTACYDGTARVWNAADGNETYCLRTGELINEALFACDGSRIYVQGISKAFVARVHGGGLPMLIAGHRSAVLHAAFRSDSRWIATVDAGGLTLVHDVHTGERLAEFSGGSESMRRVCFLGSRVLATASDGSCSMFEVESGRCLQRFQIGTDPVRLLRVPGGDAVVIACGKRVIRLDLRGERRGEFVGHAAEVTCMDVSPDGRTLATGANDRTVRVWDLASGGLLAMFDEWTEEHSGPSLKSVFAVRFSPQGDRLLIATDDATLRCYSVPLGRLLWSDSPRMRVGDVVWLDEASYFTRPAWSGACAIESCTPSGLFQKKLLFPAPQGRPMSLSISPDRSKALVSATSGQTQVWDLGEPALFATVTGHDGAVVFSEFSPDGSCFVTTSADGTARLWPVDPAAAARERMPEILAVRER